MTQASRKMHGWSAGDLGLSCMVRDISHCRGSVCNAPVSADAPSSASAARVRTRPLMQRRQCLSCGSGVRLILARPLHWAGVACATV